MQTSMPETMRGSEVSKASLLPGAKVGVWKVAELLGAGGMGEVYRAERADGLFEQQVALKIAKTKTKAFRERFDAERQRLAQLEHPNIARIVDGGSSESGAPYMTMEFVDGQPINEFASTNRLNQNQRLSLIERLCAAVAHAHGRLVLHRDIKHDNVLINADGELRLIDFGVASLLDDPEGSQGRGPLTIAYAAPEQLRGEPVSAATDIFAIGMLAHLLETDLLPLRQSDGSVAIDRNRIGDPDLVAILSRATADTPTDRYGSVDALRDDLQKFTGGFPVAARPVAAVTRFKKMVARNKLASAMSGAALAAVVAGVIGVSVFAVRANEARAEAEERLEWAEYSLRETNLESDRVGAQQELFQRFVVEEASIEEEQLRTFLLNSADAAKLDYDENPEAASAIVSSVANYLLRRGDYASSAELARYVAEHERTPEIRAQDAKIMLGRNLRELGDNEGSTQMLREVLDWMQEKPFLLKTEGYAGIATNYALATKEPSDMREALRVNLLLAQDLTKDSSGRAYYYNSASVISGLLGEFDNSIKYGVEAVELSSQAENINFVSLNTRSLNLVDAILHIEQDVQRARKYMPDEAEVMDPEKGHLRHRSMFHQLESLMLQIEGNHAESFEKAKLAWELASADYPPNSPFGLALVGLAAESAALAGKPKEARKYLADAMTPVDGTDGKPHIRGYIAQAFVLNAEGKRDEARAIFKTLDEDAIQDDNKLVYKQELLSRTLGLNN
ncbi:MAG: serine/threonine-protein kinase [Pseudomonadota bacterium]